jgi:sensor histidine kinase regulating citrate/malate metabolism
MKKPDLITYFTVAVILSILILLIYASVQQGHRTAANDPQLQVAGDMAGRLANGKTIENDMTGDTVEISQSLAVFKTLFSAEGRALRSTGFLDGKLPRLPDGVFNFTKDRGEDVITWQPRAGVRVAMVIHAVRSGNIGFVGVGRSLLEVEKREANLTKMIMISWIVCMGMLLLHWLLMSYFKRDKLAV